MKRKTLIFVSIWAVLALGCLNRIGLTIYTKKQMSWVDLKPIPNVPDMFLLKASEPVNSWLSLAEVRPKTQGATLILRPILSSRGKTQRSGKNFSSEYSSEHGWYFVYPFKIENDIQKIALGKEDDVIWTRQGGFVWKPNMGAPAYMQP